MSRLLAQCEPHSLANKKLVNTKGELGPFADAFGGIKTNISNERSIKAPKHSKTPFFLCTAGPIDVNARFFKKSEQII